MRDRYGRSAGKANKEVWNWNTNARLMRPISLRGIANITSKHFHILYLLPLTETNRCFYFCMLSGEHPPPPPSSVVIYDAPLHVFVASCQLPHTMNQNKAGPWVRVPELWLETWKGFGAVPSLPSSLCNFDALSRLCSCVTALCNSAMKITKIVKNPWKQIVEQLFAWWIY